MQWWSPCLAFDLTMVVPLMTLLFFSGFGDAGTSVAGGVPAGSSAPGSAAVVVSELGMHVDVKYVGAMHAGG